MHLYEECSRKFTQIELKMHEDIHRSKHKLCSQPLFFRQEMILTKKKVIRRNVSQVLFVACSSKS